jgi:FtsP/CotA-like multicopper oxidase with cupredoxin domain
MNLSRRSLLKLGAVGVGAGAAGLVLPLGQSASTADWASTLPPSRMPKPYAARLRRSPALPYREMVDGDGPYRLYTVTQTSGQLNVIDGLPTPAYGYGYRDVSGNQHFSVPGPVVSVPRGTRVKLRVKNELPATHAQWGYSMSTSTHLHGSASLPQYDGYADDLTQPGRTRTTGTRTSSRPGRCGTTTTASTTPLRPSTAGSPRSTTCTTRPSGRCCRRAATTCPSRSATRSSTPLDGWSTRTTSSRASGAT